MVAYHRQCTCAERGMTHICAADPADATATPTDWHHNEPAPLPKNRQQRRREAALARKGH